MKLKDGIRISCKIHGIEIKEAVVVREDSILFICQDVIGGAECKNKKGFKYSWCIDEGTSKDLIHNMITDIKPLSNSLENIYEGAVIVNEDGDKREILGICGRVVFVSRKNSFDISFGCFFTIEELRKVDYKLDLPEPEPEPNMIEIKGKKWSEDTIQEALKKYVED